MKRVFLAAFALLVLIGMFLLVPYTAEPAVPPPQFVQWIDSTYVTADSQYYGLDDLSEIHWCNSGDSLFIDPDTIVVTADSLTAVDTTFHFQNTGDTLFFDNGDTVFTANVDTVVMSPSLMVRQTPQWIYVIGATDSVISKPFSMLTNVGGNFASATGRTVAIQTEIVSGTADSTFAYSRLLLSGSPMCAALPDSELTFTYGSMAMAQDSASAVGIGDVSTFILKAPASCGRIVIMGYGDNATVYPGTKCRAWVVIE